MEVAVWIVDDDDIYRELLVVLLESHCAGVLARSFGSGDEAVRALRGTPAAERPGLLLLDFHMPGFDAPGVLRAMAAAGVLVPTVVLSSAAGEAEQDACLAAGAAAFACKPTRTEDLIHMLVQLTAAIPLASLRPGPHQTHEPNADPFRTSHRPRG
jgi:FixJ family two-component response regulator